MFQNSNFKRNIFCIDGSKTTRSFSITFLKKKKKEKRKEEKKNFSEFFSYKILTENFAKKSMRPSKPLKLIFPDLLLTHLFNLLFIPSSEVIPRSVGFRINAIWDVIWDQTNLFRIPDRPPNTLSQKEFSGERS